MFMHHLLEPARAPLDLEPPLALPAPLAEAEPEAVQACKILIIDDEEPNVRLLGRVLKRAGFDNFVGTTDSREAAALFADFQPDIVFTDWLMPELDGCGVIEQLREMTATDDFLPIVVLTADVTMQTKKRALAAGATDFLTKPFDQLEVTLRLRNLLKARLAHLTIQRQNETLEESVRQRTIELEQALSELQRSQQQVIQQERLAALGTMAGGIAHDFNNALSIIMGYAEMMLRDAESGQNTQSPALSISTILTAAEDAARIVRRLGEFYRPLEAGEEHLPVNLNELVEQAVSLTRPRWHTAATAGGRSITVATALSEIPAITGDAAELREALTNLIFNAVDALPEGGTITLGTQREGEAVVLSISDTGTGMSEEVRQRCLEPFYTTKGQRGTGLGLSMVFGIILRHGGTIDIQSQPGQGTTFALSLPVARAEGGETPVAAAAARAPLHILLVDDQPILCELVCQHLRDDLHTVETALSGHEALEKFRAGRFDLVITDHVMAGMTGEQLAVALKEIAPRIPVILLTGYGGETKAAHEGACKAIDLVVGKPLSRAALRQALAAVGQPSPATPSSSCEN